MQEPEIVYEDNHLLALNKPAGWLVQGDQTGDKTLTDWGKEYLKVKYEKPGAVFLNPVHRIDRPVSGLVLFARTDKALGRLTALFRDREIKKSYLAICYNQPEEFNGTLKHYLIKNREKNIAKAFKKEVPNSKEAILEYAINWYGNEQCLLEVTPQTGRPHQIRVQLSFIGCPILGDLKYGAPEPLPDASIALHSRSLSFIHPVKKEPIELVAELPEEEWWKKVV